MIIIIIEKKNKKKKTTSDINVIKEEDIFLRVASSHEFIDYEAK